MISDQIHRAVDPRLAEVQRMLALVEKLENGSATQRDAVSAENASTLRGLFFVHLYAALEYSITISVEVLLQEMTKLAVPFDQFEHMLHAVVLDDHFRGLADPALKLRWSRRRELLSRQVSHEECSLNDTVFQDQLQNLWYSTLHSIFEYLCISRDAVPEERMRGYIDEIVGRRNAVAHGRQAAHEVGRNVTSADLKERIEAIARVVDHVIEAFDEYLEGRHFIAANHRVPYVTK